MPAPPQVHARLLSPQSLGRSPWFSQTQPVLFARLARGGGKRRVMSMCQDGRSPEQPGNWERSFCVARELLGKLMSKAEKYQRFAEACLEIASAAKDDKIKAALMHMAQVWLRLAASRPKEVEKDEAD